MFNDGVIVTDGAGMVTFLNAVAQQLTGWKMEDALGIAIGTILPPAADALRNLHDGAIVWLLKETTLISRDLQTYPVDGSASPIRGAGGGLIGSVLVFRDLTELNKAREEHLNLAAIVEFSEDAIVWETLDGTVTSWNAAAARIFGYQAAEMIGNNISLLDPPGRPKESAAILQLIRNGDSLRRRETCRRRKDGEEIVVDLSASATRDTTDRIVGVCEISHDITSRKRMQEQFLRAQKLESLSVLAGGVAHDFNNLLMGIIGNATLIQDEAPLDLTITELTENILAATEQAAHLTRQMLAYSGRGQYSVQPISLASQIEAAVNLVRASIPKTVQLNLHLSAGLPRIDGDAGQIRQVVTNLALNAVEALDGSGVVTISTAIRQVDDGSQPGNLVGLQLSAGRYLALEVTDTGSGMDEATQAKMFDPFFTTRFTGRGLGLAAVLGIVRGHRGGIAVSSEPGKGTIFQVLFPLRKKRASAPPAGLEISATV